MYNMIISYPISVINGLLDIKIYLHHMEIPFNVFGFTDGLEQTRNSNSNNVAIISL